MKMNAGTGAGAGAGANANARKRKRTHARARSFIHSFMCPRGGEENPKRLNCYAKRKRAPERTNDVNERRHNANANERTHVHAHSFSHSFMCPRDDEENPKRLNC